MLIKLVTSENCSCCNDFIPTWEWLKDKYKEHTFEITDINNCHIRGLNGTPLIVVGSQKIPPLKSRESLTEVLNNAIIEQHIQDFFQFVHDNEKQLKKNLKKNITYDEDLFEDCFWESVLKVAEYIKQKRKLVGDFEQFLFIVSKRLYIAEQAKQRKRNQVDDYTFFEELNDLKIEKNHLYEYDGETDEQEERFSSILKLFSWLGEYLENYFTPREVDIYLIYYKLKSENHKVSYKKLAEITQTNINYISNVIQKIKKFIAASEEIKEMEQKMLYGTNL